MSSLPDRSDDPGLCGGWATRLGLVGLQVSVSDNATVAITPT